MFLLLIQVQVQRCNIQCHLSAGSAFINLHSMKTVGDVLAMLDHSDQVVNSTQFTGPQAAPISMNAAGKREGRVHFFFYKNQ